MKYYIIETNKKNPLPDIRSIYSEINVKYLSPRYEYKLQDYYVFEMKTAEETLMPDIFTDPFFMVKREIYKVVMMYVPEMKVKYISFVDYERGMYETYVAPVLDVIEQKKLGQIDISEKVLFCISDIFSRYIVMRLDLLESILRRDILGLKVREFLNAGEINDDKFCSRESKNSIRNQFY